MTDNLVWYDSKPKSDFEDTKSVKTISLLSSVSYFGIILHKKNSELLLYLGAKESESHHIVSIPEITSIPCNTPCIPADITLMRLGHDYIHPLCSAIEPCKIYRQSPVLSDFVFGIVGRRVDSQIIRSRAKSFLAKRQNARLQNDITKPVLWKLEQNSFFVTSIFFSSKNTLSFLSSVNFTNKLSVPNSLIPAKNTHAISILNNPPRLSWLGGAKTPVLSLTECASVLSLPSLMFGLEMRPGTDKTFSNIHSTEDPADFFSDILGKR